MFLQIMVHPSGVVVPLCTAKGSCELQIEFDALGPSHQTCTIFRSNEEIRLQLFESPSSAAREFHSESPPNKDRHIVAH